MINSQSQRSQRSKSSPSCEERERIKISTSINVSAAFAFSNNHLGSHHVQQAFAFSKKSHPHHVQLLRSPTHHVQQAFAFSKKVIPIMCSGGRSCFTHSLIEVCSGGRLGRIGEVGEGCGLGGAEKFGAETGGEARWSRRRRQLHEGEIECSDTMIN